MQKIQLLSKKYKDIEIDGKVTKVKDMNETEKLEMLDYYSELEELDKKIQNVDISKELMQDYKKGKEIVKQHSKDLREAQCKILHCFLSAEDTQHFIDLYDDYNIINMLILSIIKEMQFIQNKEIENLSKKFKKDL